MENPTLMITIIASTNRKNAYSLKIAKYYKEELDKRNINTHLVDLQNLPADFIESALYENSGKNEEFNKLRNIVQESEKLFLFRFRISFIIPSIMILIIE